MLSRTPRTVWGVLVPRVRSASGASGSCPWSGDAGAGFLTPRGFRSGLDGPMPATITLVVAGRCRPSPDRVPSGTPADRDARGIVSAGLAVLGGQKAATSRGQGRFDEFHVHPPEPVFVLDHDRGHVRVGQRQLRLRAGTVHTRGDLGLDPHDLATCPGRPSGQPGHLAFKVIFLVTRGNQGVQAQAADRFRCGVRRDVHQDRARSDPLSRYRQRPLTEPAIHGPRMRTPRLRPFRQIHT